MGKIELPGHLVKACEEVGSVDILVGVLCKNVEATILHVLNVANEGLYTYFPEYSKGMVISIGESNDRTREMAELFQPYNGISKIITEDIGGSGKGAGVRTIMKVARLLNADALILLDGDLLSVRPKWIESIAAPIIYGRADLTIPFYIRHKYDGVITNILAYPFTRAVYGVDIRQPIAGEFGISRELCEKLLEHPLFPMDFGIDIFIVTVAAAEGMMVKESLFTQKIHESTTRYLEPEKLLIPMFRQVVGEMFELAKYYEKVWKSRERYRLSRNYRTGLTQKPIPVKVDIDKFIEMFREGYRDMKDVIQRYLPADINSRLEDAYNDIEKLDADTWAKAVYRFAAAYRHLERDIDKYILIEALKSLWLGRFASYAIEVKDMDTEEAERVVQKQAKVFEDNFDYFISLQ